MSDISLRTFSFGALRLVGENPFYRCYTDVLTLNLSSLQAELKFDESAHKWVPTEQSYWDTEDYERKMFLGYTFAEILSSEN